MVCWPRASFLGRSDRTEPGISRFRVRGSRAPERQQLNFSQPSLSPLETFQVLETLALVAGSAEIKLFHVLIVAQFIGGAVEHDLTLLHDIAVAGDGERGARVLLHQ